MRTGIDASFMVVGSGRSGTTWIGEMLAQYRMGDYSSNLLILGKCQASMLGRRSDISALMAPVTMRG